jgi:hypothetical protein
MRHLKKFENFDLGHRFSEEDEDTQIQKLGLDEEEGDEECKPCGSDEEEGEQDEYTFSSEGDEDDDDEKNWNDEEELRLEKVVSFHQFEAKKGESYKKSGLKNPEKADLNKDKKISGYEKKRGKAVQDAVEEEKEEKSSKKEEKGGKGLTAAQKKLPEGLRKAIEARKNK